MTQAHCRSSVVYCMEKIDCFKDRLSYSPKQLSTDIQSLKPAHDHSAIPLYHPFLHFFKYTRVALHYHFRPNADKWHGEYLRVAYLPQFCFPLTTMLAVEIATKIPVANHHFTKKAAEIGAKRSKQRKNKYSASISGSLPYVLREKHNKATVCMALAIKPNPLSAVYHRFARIVALSR